MNNIGISIQLYAPFQGNKSEVQDGDRKTAINMHGISFKVNIIILQHGF